MRPARGRRPEERPGPGQCPAPLVCRRERSGSPLAPWQDQRQGRDQPAYLGIRGDRSGKRRLPAQDRDVCDAVAATANPRLPYPDNAPRWLPPPGQVVGVATAVRQDHASPVTCITSYHGHLRLGNQSPAISRRSHPGSTCAILLRQVASTRGGQCLRQVQSFRSWEPFSYN